MKLADVAKAAGTDDLETVFWILRHASANPEKHLQQIPAAGQSSPLEASWRAVPAAAQNR
jgi:glucose-6-phosphate isomerase